LNRQYRFFEMLNEMIKAIKSKNYILKVIERMKVPQSNPCLFPRNSEAFSSESPLFFTLNPFFMLNANHLQSIVESQLSLTTGADLSKDLTVILGAAKESRAWASLGEVQKANLNFQVEKLTEFLVNLDLLAVQK
jgi:hypothetical protein